MVGVVYSDVTGSAAYAHGISGEPVRPPRKRGRTLAYTSHRVEAVARASRTRGFA
jgi:hypothetical protein